MKREEKKQKWNFVYAPLKDGYAIVGVEECGIKKELILIDENDNEIERFDIYCIMLSGKEAPYIAADEEAIKKMKDICEDKRRDYRENITIS